MKKKAKKPVVKIEFESGRVLTLEEVRKQEDYVSGWAVMYSNVSHPKDAPRTLQTYPTLEFGVLGLVEGLKHLMDIT